MVVTRLRAACFVPGTPSLPGIRVAEREESVDHFGVDQYLDGRIGFCRLMVRPGVGGGNEDGHAARRY